MASAAPPGGGGVPVSIVTGALEPAGLAHYLSPVRAVPALCLVGASPLHGEVIQRLLHCKQQHHLAFHVRQVEDAAQLRGKKEERVPGFAYESLLKADWCRKHQHDVFGCVILLVNIDASNSREAFESAAEAAVDNVRAKLGRRQSNLLVVVTTAADRLPFYEKPDSCQSAVRKKCDLDNAKCVALLYAGGMDQGVRLIAQQAEERAHTYYKDEVKRVKKAKDNAPKAVQPRHLFKIGFFYEARGQYSTAIKYYAQCYEDMRAYSADTFASREIKGCSEAVMFRRCLLRLLYEDNPKPALVPPAVAKQFREHLSWYRSCGDRPARGQPAPRGGHPRDTASQTRSLHSRGYSQERSSETPSAPYQRATATSSISGEGGSFASSALPSGQPGWDLLAASESQALAQAAPTAVIAHHAAVARQCERFAWLLVRAQQRVGEHAAAVGDADYACPAYHYHCAALALQLRRRCVLHSPGGEEMPFTAEDVAAEQDPVFLGQGIGGAAGDAQKEASMLLAHERQVNHLGEITQLCRQARAAYGQSRPRLGMILGFHIARAQADASQYVEAKNTLLEVLPHFVQHPWPGVTDAMLRLLMALSVRTGSVEDYLKAALEYMAGEGPDRVRVFAAISAWARGDEVPESDGDPFHCVFPKAPQASANPMLSVHSPNHPFVSVMCQFHRPLVCVHEPAVLRVRLATRAAFGIPITRLAVQFLNGSGDFDKAVEDTVLRRGRPVILEHDVVLTEPGVVRVKAITVGLGSISVSRGVPKDAPELQALLTRLVNAPATAGAASLHTLETSYPHLGYHLDAPPLFKDRPAVRVLKPTPAVTLALDHMLPVLLNEIYAVKLVIGAGPEAVIGGSIILPGIFNVTVTSARDAHGQEIAATVIEDEGDSLFGNDAGGGAPLQTTELALPEGIAAEASTAVTIYFKFAAAGEHAFNLLFHYSTERCRDMQKALPCEFQVVVPFNLEVCVMDTKTWGSGGVDAALQDPARRTVYRHTTSVPHQNHKRLLNTTGAARLGVMTQSSFMPYGVTTSKISRSDVQMRRHQQATLSVNAICTVDAFDIEITDVHVLPGTGVKLADIPCVEATVLAAEEEVCYTWSVEPTEATDMSGEVEVHVRRAGSADPPVPYAFNLPEVKVQDVPVVARVELPSHGRVGEPMLLTLHLRNTSATASRGVRLNTHDGGPASGRGSPSRVRGRASGFLWAGRTQTSLTLVPSAEAQVQFHLVPVSPGRLTLPALAVHVERFPHPVVAINERASVFVDTCNAGLRVPPTPAPQE